MKQKVLAYIFVLAAIISCDSNVPMHYSNPNQERLIQFLQKSKHEGYGKTNDIQKKEYDQFYKESFYNLLVDSLKFVSGFEGRIDDIRLTEGKESIKISFSIECPIESKYGYLSLKCQHVVNNSDKATDAIYQAVYNMRERQKVIFDGFAQTTNKDELKWESYFSTDLSMDISYPKIGFWATGVYPYPHDEKLSDNLLAACRLSLETMTLIKKHNDKQISNSEYNKKSAEIKKANDEINKHLSEKEKDYLKTVSTDALYNISF